MASNAGNAATAVERGLPIMRDTGCRVGLHIFVWSGVWHSTSQRPEPHQPCLCGITTYGEAS